MIRNVTAAVVLTLGLASVGFAQTGDSFESYPIDFGPAKDAEAVLQQLLHQHGIAGQVMADPRQNRIFVSGSPDAHRAVQEYLQSASRQNAAAHAQQQQAQQHAQRQYAGGGQSHGHPQGMSQGDPSQAALMTKTYAIEQPLLTTCESEIRRRFERHPQVRIASVPETSRLAVRAPMDVHQQIAAQIDEISRQLGRGSANQSAVGTASQGPWGVQQSRWNLRPADNAQARYDRDAQQRYEQSQQAGGGSGSPFRSPAAQNHAAQNNQQYGNQQQSYQGNRNANPRGHGPSTLNNLGVQSDVGVVVPVRTPAELMVNVLRLGFGERMSQHPMAAIGGEYTEVYTIDLNQVRDVDYGTLRLEWDLSRSQVVIHGYADMVNRMAYLLTTLDDPQALERREIFFRALDEANPDIVMDLVNTVGRNRDSAPTSQYMVGNLFYRRQPQGQPPQGQPPQGQPGQGQIPPGAQPGQGGQVQDPFPPLTSSGVQRPIRAEVIEGIGIVLTGTDADLAQLVDLIDNIILQSDLSEPLLESYPLRHVDPVEMATIVQGIYDETYQILRGPVSLRPFYNPNSMLLIGQRGAVDTAKSLIGRLDQPGVPSAQFRVFSLRNADALTIADAITQILAPTSTLTLEPQVVVVPDDRSNTLIVRGSERDLAQVAELIEELDTTDTGVQLEVQAFELYNSTSVDMLNVLQGILFGQAAGGGGGGGGGQFGGVQAPSASAGVASIELVLGVQTPDGLPLDLHSGILTNIRMSADPRANLLIVSAPAEAMELIAALIQTLDSATGADAEVKIFPVDRGDANLIVDMLRTLFGQQAQQGGGGGGGFGQQQGGVASVTGEGIIPLRFATDSRTNSVLAAGSANDLILVAGIIEKLEASLAVDRETKIYKLKNVPALSVANALNQMAQTELDLAAGQLSTYQLQQQQVIVVPEEVTNSLIVVAPPRYWEQVETMINDLDRKPPMVMIQVVIAEVGLNNTDEFGVELGLQDSILFDRSLVSITDTITNSTQANQGGAIVTDTRTEIIGAEITPGFLFGNPLTQLPNSGSDAALGSAGRLAGQSLTHFSVGRVNSELGYGGLVLSASSESISMLVRALQESRRLDVISRPQIQTLDNQAAYVQVGQRVQLPTGATTDQLTGATQVAVQAPDQATNVGIILGVVPRITMDGQQVVMQIDVEKSELGPEVEGIAIATNPLTGETIRVPRINTVTAQTTVSGVDGQTIVLGGLITRTENKVHRRVPLLASIPVLGHLFRYDLKSVRKTELLIIMTPRVLKNPADEEYIKMVESQRMSWVLSNIDDIHGGPNGLASKYYPHGNPACVIFPDLNPNGVIVPQGMPQDVPTPAGGDPMNGGAMPGNGMPPGVDGFDFNQAMAPPGSTNNRLLYQSQGNQAPLPPGNPSNFADSPYGVQQTSYYRPPMGGGASSPQQYEPGRMTSAGAGGYGVRDYDTRYLPRNVQQNRR